MDKHPCTAVTTDFFHTAPHVYRAEVEINATPDRIFEYFEDAHSWTLWADPINKVEWTSPQPFGLGTTRTVYMQGDMVGWETFIAWERGKHMSFCFTEMSKPMNESFAEDYKVTDLGNGRCKVVWQMAMQPKGFSRFITPLIGPIMRRMLQKWLNNFADLVHKDELVVAKVADPTSATA
jgi:hypothetical protein